MLKPRYQYDIPTAVTFLIAGVGIGSILAMLFSHRPDRPVLDRSSASGTG
jgi:hypothetical protein